MANRTTPARRDYTNTSETIGFRLGAALRAGELAGFIAGIYPRELSELAAAASALRTVVSERTAREIVFALGARSEAFDAAAATSCRPAFARKFRKCGDAAEACQLAWSAANMSYLRANREIRAAA